MSSSKWKMPLPPPNSKCNKSKNNITSTVPDNSSDVSKLAFLLKPYSIIDMVSGQR